MIAGQDDAEGFWSQLPVKLRAKRGDGCYRAAKTAKPETMAMHARSAGATMMKAYMAGVCAFAIALAAIAVSPASSQPRKKRYVTTTTTRVVANRPRSRVVVVPRSFLDAGTEVLPGERKFTDYAFPPTYTPLGVVQNTGGRVGWHRSPLPGPFDLPGRNNPFGY
jgi:hypothetical protein